MKIALIFTGGTIGSEKQNGSVSPNENTKNIFLETIENRYKNSVQFETVSPFTILSENSNGEVLKKLTNCILQKANENCDGIVVFHGTDTLAFSSAAIGYTVGNNVKIPIVTVSANYPHNDSRSNAYQNIYSAIDFILQTEKAGTFTAYKNTNGVPTIHRSTRLLEQNAFTDDVFSVKNNFYGYFNEKNIFVKNENYTEIADETKPFDISNISETSSVLKIKPYPAMSLPKLTSETTAVLFESYHSGSICTDSKLFQRFCFDAKDMNIPIFIAGQKCEYESAVLYDKLGIKPIVNIAPPSLFLKIWFATATNRIEDIEKSLASDIINI